SAASSLTSPPPVAPMRNPGSIKRSPTSSPSSEEATPMDVACHAARATPHAAMPPVSALGTRRQARSVITPAPPAPATIATTRELDKARNRLPEKSVEGLPDRGHRHDRDDGDERHQKRVLEQILTVVVIEDAGGER